jgi:hypothetical protein
VAHTRVEVLDLEQHARATQTAPSGGHDPGGASGSTAPPSLSTGRPRRRSGVGLERSISPWLVVTTNPGRLPASDEASRTAVASFPDTTRARAFRSSSSATR